MEYISQALGVKVTRKTWSGIKKIPYLITNEYAINQVTIDECDCLFLKPVHELGTISVVKKHLARLKEVSSLPVVFEFDALSRQRKKSFIEARIPFVVTGKQLYLQFVGAILQERSDTETADMIVDKLQPSAQMVLFRIIYGKNEPYYITESVSQFGFSAMTASRAADQLVRTGLFEVYKDGVQKVLKTELTTKELFEKAKKYLINPVRRKVYIDKKDITDDMFAAGLSALSARSMINPSELEVYGTAKPIKAKSICPVLYDTDRQYELEMWKYDPRLLDDKGIVDALSLAVSFGDTVNERIEQAADEILKGLW